MVIVAMIIAKIPVSGSTEARAAMGFDCDSFRWPLAGPKLCRLDITGHSDRFVFHYHGSRCWVRLLVDNQPNHPVIGSFSLCNWRFERRFSCCCVRLIML